MPDILTPAQVAECRERAERATEGPWTPYKNYHGWHMMIPGEGEHGDNLVLKRELEEANIKFACSARTDIPALCATIEALQAEIERLRAALLQIVGLPDAHARSLEIAVDALAALEGEA